MDELHPLVQNHTQQARHRIRQSRSRGELANFTEGDYVLVPREYFFQGEKLCLLWRRPRRVLKALNDYIYLVEDLRTGDFDDVHGTLLKFYSDDGLDEKEIMSHVLSSETGMPLSRLLRLVEQDGDLFVLVRWKGLSSSDDTPEPLSRVFEDVPALTRKLLQRKSTPGNLRCKAHAALDL